VSYRSSIGDFEDKPTPLRTILLRSVITHNGACHPVRAISDHGFAYCQLTRVGIPHSISGLQAHCFRQSTLYFPAFEAPQLDSPDDDVFCISEKAFSQCFALRSFCIPSRADLREELQELRISSRCDI
jgi:hypothetical protein